MDQFVQNVSFPKMDPFIQKFIFLQKLRSNFTMIPVKICNVLNAGLEGGEVGQDRKGEVDQLVGDRSRRPGSGPWTHRHGFGRVQVPTL
jgi:hypothetical protein